ncbi:antibiotic biosynthesis monooxygenase family protein [Pseudomonas sp. NA-150]|uniref:antibiotic biosynthesis monooxygenase family protein n=1 Tax=Pseudomonas sp. NA-150 TaxID=3367525 RepID=UPI0037CBAB31
MTKPNPVSHLVFARAAAGCSAHLGVRLSSLIEPALDLPGCLSFALQQSLLDPEIWMLNGVWTSELAMTGWFATPELSVFSELVQERVVSSLDFQTFKQVTAIQAETACQPTQKMVG